MPHENREIVFSLSEFLDALLRYGEMRGGHRYRARDIRQVGVDPKGGGTAELTFKDDEKVKYSESDILAGLIAYCIEHKVPLPARAGKKVRVNDDGVTLAVESKVDWVPPVDLPLTMKPGRG